MLCAGIVAEALHPPDAQVFDRSGSCFELKDGARLTRRSMLRTVVIMQLIEINAHSLFSKWFSESGKLVMKLFEQIQEMVEDTDTFVSVMIDEVRRRTLRMSAPMSALYFDIVMLIRRRLRVSLRPESHRWVVRSLRMPFVS